nr:Ig-like domain-containing protein [uncultured Psychrobacter sp.]
MLTGKDKTTINIRVTDKNGGIVSNVPVSINVSNAAMYGLALDAPSNQITDEKGLITVDLLQGTKGIDSQLDHESLLTVTANSLEGVIKQTLPIIVSGTSANNVLSSKNTVNAGENFSLSGQIVDGVGNPVANADVVLYSNDKQAGIGRLDNNGNFLFDLNSSTLEALNNNFLFSIEVKGIEINQRIPDILTVVTPAVNPVDLNLGDFSYAA